MKIVLKVSINPNRGLQWTKTKTFLRLNTDPGLSRDLVLRILEEEALEEGMLEKLVTGGSTDRVLK